MQEGTLPLLRSRHVLVIGGLWLVTTACAPSSSSDANTSSSSTVDAPGSSGSQAEAEAESGAGPESSDPVDTTTGEADTTTGEVDTTTSESSTTGEPAAVCGNKIVEADEECDDPGDTKCYKCVRDRIVFITSEQVWGDFSDMSLANLDYWCNHLAAVQGLLTNNQPRFKTWVSTSQESAAERIFHSPGRYVLMNGLVFAESWDALMAGHILNPLNVDEKSEKGKSGAFTDTRPDGTAMPGTHCDD